MGLSWVRALGGLFVRLPRGLWALVAALWAGLIWWLSTHEGGVGDGNHVMEWLNNLGHAPLFGLLALWLALAAPRAGGWARLSAFDRSWIFLAVVVWGVVDELHQARVPGRDASVFDIGTDAVGALSVLAVAAAAGLPEATPASVRKRLALGLVACGLAALAATLETM